MTHRFLRTKPFASPIGWKTMAALGLWLSASCATPCGAGACETADEPEWFHLRPEVEKAYGYTHAVRIGDSIKISGAVSMDATGTPTAAGDLEQQIRNVYEDLRQVLAHYGCTFDDVVVENIFTTDMANFLPLSGYRAEIYTTQFPTGSWLEVKGLALPEFMLEIELEAHRPR